MKILAVLFSFSLIASPVFAQQLTDYVNPFIGTTNSGNTNPGVVLPWGMLSLSPFNSYDTISHAVGASPYYFGNKYISGFTHLNMSGVGCADMGVFCVMPTMGNMTLHQPANCSEYSREYATAGYYSVFLDRFKVKAELTTSTRAGVSRYTFPKGKANILLNLGLGLTSNKGAAIKKVSSTEVEGFKTTGDFCGLANKQVVFFVARINKTPLTSGIWSNGKQYDDYSRIIAGDDVGAFFNFETNEGEQIEVRLAVSFVSVANARENLEKEVSNTDFEQVRAAATQEWNDELSKIEVYGGTKEDRIKFYTALYHTLIHPSVFTDVNGESPAMESDSISLSNGFTRYTVFSLWDTYRNVHPFLSLVYPDRQLDMVKSLLAMYKENGWLPKWELAGSETNCMVGDPATIVIADSYLRGIKGFDLNVAYDAMRHNATAPGIENTARPGLDDWHNLGYIPDDADYTLKNFTSTNIANEYTNARQLKIVWGSVSSGLEYCISDWNLAQFAKAIGKKSDYQAFFNRSLNYKNSFDKTIGFVRPRLKDGSWLTPFDPASNRLNGFTEGNSWNYTFMVPHDIGGLINLMGGSKQFIKKLASCFDNDHFNITNEPDLAYPYLFNYVEGEEWRTQQVVKQTIQKDFTNSPGGLPGNDDCGTMSAWLVYSMMGFYPDCPGSMDYQLTSPTFDKVIIHLNRAFFPGKTFEIEAMNPAPGNHFIRSMKLNGNKHLTFRINHDDIVKGGRLTLILKNGR